MECIKFDYGKLKENEHIKHYAQLCASEAQANTLHLLYCVARGKFFYDIKNQHPKDFDAYLIATLNISLRQVQRYLKFYFVVTNHKRLLVSRKSFTDIVHYASIIEKTAANDTHVNSLLSGPMWELKTVDDQIVDLEDVFKSMKLTTE